VSTVHPRHDLDTLLTNPVRLSIVAILAGAERAEFALVRDAVEITDAMLSKQAALLEEAGYVEVEKGRAGRRPRTWLRLTALGHGVYGRHVRALHLLLSPRDEAGSPPT
jgi:DNA-binding MarR family transcriptional regulator